MARRTRDVNPIDVVEAAYRLDLDDRAWLDNLTRQVRPLLDGGHGIIAYRFDLEKPAKDWYADAIALDFDRRELPIIGRVQRAMPDVVELILSGFDGLTSMRELGPRVGIGDIRKAPLIGDYFKKHGLEDLCALQTLEPGGRGLVIAAGQSERRTYDRRTRRLWQRISAHIAAGRRLRDAIVYSRPLDEAVLKPSGKIENAEGDGASKSARLALQDAVARIEKARGKQRRSDPDGATEAWTAMVSGRWSLVDRFERGGRRYIVARRNDHSLRDPRALTSRERAIVHLAALGKSNKLIGYELGLAESTVGSHLSTAMRKLGVASRVDLLRFVLAFGPPET